MARLQSCLQLFLLLALIVLNSAQVDVGDDSTADGSGIMPNSEPMMNETMGNVTEPAVLNKATPGPIIRTPPLVAPTALPGTAGSMPSAGPPPGAPPLAVRLRNCTDIPPGTRHTCAQQRQFGKCEEDYIVKFAYCSKTCGHPPCCFDKPPPGNYSCEQQKAFGKCDTDFMVKGNYCSKTCMREPCPTTPPPSPKNATRPMPGMLNATSWSLPALNESAGNRTGAASLVEGSGMGKSPKPQGAPLSVEPVTTAGMFTP